MSKKQLKSSVKRKSSLIRNVFSKRFLINVVSSLLIITILSVSTPAAPEIIVSATGKMAQDLRYSYLSSNLAFNFSNWFAGFFKTSSSSKRAASADIKIFPGSVTVQQGEQVNFSAVVYDSQNNPLSGLDFNWQFSDTGRRLPARPLHKGRFEAKVPGTFTVVVESGGKKAQAVVTVTSSAAGSSNQSDLKAIAPIKVSSRADETSETEKESKEGQQPTPESENLMSIDDPGNQPGNPPGQPSDDGASNGNFQLTAPIISLPGRGMEVSLNLNYNSRLWNKSGSTLTYDSDRGFPAPGWSLGFGKVIDMGAGSGSMLVDADGTRHGYSGTIFPGYGGYSSFQGYSTDGKFVDYKSFRDNGGVYYAWAQFPNGTYISYGAKANGAVYPTYIRSAQGNYITVTYKNNQGPAIETITDTLGRVITFNYDSSTPARLISITAPRMQDGGATSEEGSIRTLLRLHYKPLTLNYSFSGVTPVVGNGTPQVIDAIYYPGNQNGYWFNDTDSYSSYGMLTKVLEQRAMSWSSGTEEQGTISAGQTSKTASYNYPLTTTNAPGRTNGIGLSNAPNYTSLKESWDGRDVNEDAETTYAFDNNTVKWDGTSNSPARLVTITQPNGAISKQYSYRTPGAWTDGLVFFDETIVMNGTTPITVSSSMVSWQQGDYFSPRLNWVEISDENGKKVKTVYDYTGGLFNQVTRTCDYDDGGAKLRCSNAVYENDQSYKGTWTWQVIGGVGTWIYSGGRHIFNLVKSTSVENPDGTIAARTDFEFDNYQNQPLINTPGVIHHDPSHDPYTTETVQVQGECIRWETPWGEPSYCVEWEYYDVSVYDPATDKRGNITKITNYSDAGNPAGPSGAIYETKAHDITGNLRLSSSSCCEQTNIEYTSASQYAYPTSETRGAADPNSPHRMTATSNFDFDTGLIRQQTDANGRTSSITYNPDTLRPIISTSSTGSYTLVSYDNAAMTVTEESHQSNNALAGKTITYLNGLGLTKRVESFGVNNVLDIVETKYNKYAEEWKQSRPFRTGDTPQWRETVYDTQGRVSKIIEPDGSETKAFYNETQRPDSASTLFGNTIRAVDAWGRERWARYDQQGQLAEVVEPNPDRTANPNGSVSVAGSLMTKYTHDTLGRLTKTEQGAQIREFKYDTLGRLIRQKLAEQTATLNDAGTFVGAGNGAAKWGEAFFYDNRSNVTMKIDARGVRTYLSYQINGTDDPLNRLQSRVYDTSGPLDSTAPVLAAPGVVYSYMTTGNKNRLSQIRTDGLLTENFTYDTEGRVRDFTQTVDARTNYPMTVSYFYDSLDRIDEVWYPVQYGSGSSTRKIVKHSYDTASRLSGLSLDNQQIAGNIVYNASNQTTSIKIGPSGTNQITEDYTFDPQTGFLTNQKVQKTGQTLLDLSYDYARNNSVGNLNGKTGHLTKTINNLDNAKNREYEFDALGRLTKAKGGASNWQLGYTYDRYGNRTNVSATGSAPDGSRMTRDGTPNLTYNTQTNRITTAGYEYDAAGNQIRAKAEDGTWLKYDYDAANRLQVVKKDDGTYLQAFQFNSTNARIMDLDYVYGYLKIIAAEGGTTLSEYTEFTSTVPTWTKSSIYFGNSPLSTITPNGSGGETTEYNHPDQLGTRTVTNQAAGTSYEQNHLPFGTAFGAESTGNQSKRFTTYERSARTGLDYAVNRTYDSKQGRFTQVDPISMAAVSLDSPQTLNLYTYCANDPVNFTDPSGLFFGKLFKWLGKVIGRLLKKVFFAAVKAAITAAFTFLTSGFNVGAAIAVFIGSFVMNLGFPKLGNILTPSWNPNAGHPLSPPSDLSSYIIKNFTNNVKGNLTPRQIEAAVIRIVRKALKKKDCRDFISQNADPLLDKDPRVTLTRLVNGTNNSRLINEGKFDTNVSTIAKGGIDNVSVGGKAAVMSGEATTVRMPTIRLFKPFYGDALSMGITSSLLTGISKFDLKAIALLHELKHVYEPTLAPGAHDAPGGWNDEIIKKCF